MKRLAIGFQSVAVLLTRSNHPSHINVPGHQHQAVWTGYWL